MSDETALPEYQRVMNDVRAQIARDDLPVGKLIPSTESLTGMYAVSTTVIRRAVAELKTEGLLRGQPGKGVYVIAKPADVEDGPSPEYTELMGEIREMRNEVQRLAQRLDALEGAPGSD